ncbi:MAG: WG repeat-containing protein [Syntrophales bacterium]|nr:WG repeat-containing protein [Syntrophales bacterium]
MVSKLRIKIFFIIAAFALGSTAFANDNIHFYQNAIDSQDQYVDDFAVAQKDGKYGFVNKNDEFVVKPKYNYAQNTKGDYFFVCKDEKGEKCTYMHKKTHKFLTIFKYIGGGNSDISEGFSEGRAKVVVTDKNGKWKTGYINESGKEVITPQYVWGSAFRNGVAEVRLTEEFPRKTIKIDKAGKVVK